ncbi:ea6e000b-5117-4fb0-a473-b6ddca3cdea7-CDS [Sclerotinia trifoliorum]|uniref:Ea6e000b-5117-4fb0-a473-b6ddca3cdea7-CDS n=1 Tax=Sclerotinia trifoliorum TaxID=28548 RepID=A0A8H2VZH6_9HELO|nr:ea6e000b-5117-4fb0-a473-b6ddca3cdea7-CDS [Sclerotinia trifoliorum]
MANVSSITLRGPRDLEDPAVTPEFQYLKSASQRVDIHHPAYDQGLLLSLYAPDAAVGGICYSLVHDACAIIAGNRHEGWLTDSPGGDPLIYESGALLPAGDYWYHLPAPVIEEDDSNSTSASVYRWPVVLSFKHWQFPNHLPSAWTTVLQRFSLSPVGRPSTYSTLIRARDRRCCITNHSTATEVAHLCPEQERVWYLQNSMFRYNSNHSLGHRVILNDANNLMLLRSDLHKAFADRSFFLYPKRDDFVVHAMEYIEDIVPLYHNTRTHPITYCRPQFIYARFAWTIFSGITAFLEGGVARSVITVKDIDGKRVKQVEEMDGDTLQELSTPGSQSSTKRQRVVLDIVQTDEEDNPVSKRQYIISSPLSVSITEDNTDTSPISLHGSPLNPEDNHDLQEEKQAWKNSLLQEWIHFDQVREQYLCKQRPTGFVPLTFESATTVREKLESVGVEFRDDTSEEADDSNCRDIDHMNH